jgi:hypothetical protein
MADMKEKILLLIIVLTFFMKNPESYSQDKVNTMVQVNKILDSLSGKGIIYKTIKEKPEVRLSREQSLTYLRSRYVVNNWINPGDPLREAIGRLLFFASGNPFDSTRFFLEKYSYDSINIPWDRFYVWDTIKLTIPDLNPKTVPPQVQQKDTIILLAKDTLHEVTGTAQGFPFRHYNWPFESDSIKTAINSLINFIEERDSSVVYLSGMSNLTTPVWLNSRSEKLLRFWLKNEYSDSVTLWAGGISRNTIGLFLEEGIIFRRPTKQFNFSEARLNLQQINSKNLQEMNQIAIKPQYWKFRSESVFILSQSSLSNWVKGGEGSISTAIDITGYADYNNKKRKVSSNNYIRLKYGLVKAGDEKIKKNQDLLETNSKLNHKAFGKFDFSAVMLFKTQIDKGYIYPTDTTKTLVSKFLNPAVLTIGFGLDYKPNKTLSINLSPLSYKGTFVTDTVHIDQTKYGIPHNKKSMHEPGASLIISSEFKPFKEITVTNRLQFFTNYIHNPQNVDVDWEMIVTSKINWFTDVRLNTHLIFDDDTKTSVLYKNGTPKPGSDGKPMKTARVQFKEMLGITFAFRF